MKKGLILALSLILVVGLTSLAMAGNGAGIVNSPHDFYRGGTPVYGNDSGEICKPCHAPHKTALMVDGILWNHDISLNDGAYTLYSSASLTGTISQPDGQTKLCLSCHDGTVAIDAYAGDDGLGGDIPVQLQVPNNTGGDDLRGTHPVSVVYDESDLGLNSISGVTLGAQTLTELLDSAGKLQCHTCHDVHDQGGEAVSGTRLLRVDNTGSAFCLKCHGKDS